MDKDVHPFKICIPRARVFTEGSSNKSRTPKMQYRKLNLKSEKRMLKPSKASLVKYSLPGEMPTKVKVIKKDELLISYANFAKLQHVERHKLLMAIKVFDGYKIVSTGMRSRLHVEEPPDDVRGVTDIVKNYFECVDGRPLPSQNTIFKSFHYMYRNQIRVRQEIGYRKDCILNIDLNYKKEKKCYEIAVKNCVRQGKYFDKFISDDYKKSMEFLNRWEELKTRVQLKNIELKNLAAESFWITSRLIGLEYKYGRLQKYGRFLYYLSPPSWRSNNRDFALSVEIEAFGFDYGISSEDDAFNVMYEKIKTECYGHFVKPALYFTHPKELMEVFDTIERQQQNHFTHVTHVAPYAKSLKTVITLLKDLISQDTAGVAGEIQLFHQSIDLYQTRSDDLEAKFYKILFGMFYETVGTLEVLKLNLHMEFCFEKVFNETPINMEMFAMAKDIENFYMDYRLRLDKMHGDKVSKAIKEYVESEKLIMKKSQEAAKELRLFERLEQQLLRSFAPVSKQREKYIVKSFCKKPSIRNINAENNTKSITEAELEYLRIFTEWTENEDPANYLHSLSMSDDKRDSHSNRNTIY